MAAATRLFPLLRPATAQNSRTRLVGTLRLPATAAKISRSCALSGRPKAAFNTASHVRQVPKSPKPPPSRRRSNNARSSSTIGTLTIIVSVIGVMLSLDLSERLRHIELAPRQVKPATDAQQGGADGGKIRQIDLGNFAQRHLPIEVAQNRGAAGKGANQFAFDTRELPAST